MGAIAGSAAVSFTAARRSTSRRAARRSLAWCILMASLMACLGATGPLAHCQEDRVVVQSGTGPQQVSWSGRIVDYNGRELVLERPSGQLQRFRADQVVAIQTTWPDTYQVADERAAAGDWAAAAPVWRQTLDRETRPWARRLLAARLVRAYYESGQFDAAAELFAALVQEDPYPPFYADWPLPWGETPGVTSLQTKALDWITRPQPALQLVGAAWLIGSPERHRAQQVLAALVAKSEHPLVAALARCQLWRLAAAGGPAPGDRQQAEVIIRQLPEAVRAGPYFVLGQWCQQQNDRDGAMLAWLRVAILYPDRPRLASEALWRAAVLTQQSDAARAAALYAELAERFASTPLAAEARRRAEALSTAESR
ncbi:MAG: hypothetical protein KatS3mg110_1428 [Pirellulaceae bacterium]|nr:MAG: hypothetical protein KatS3mg110_1428 [Pirellulaceae bacterium]